jgi:1-acyl-sn-glycerol-3-phosphate acyltransferase
MIKLLTCLVIRFTLFVICHIDKKSLKDIPLQGPMIFIGNHINFLDVLTALAFSYPRKIYFLVKKETFETPFLRFLFNTWGGIPVDRGTADFQALKKAADVLDQGHFFTIAPEGTRTKNGQLIKAQTGVVIVALRSKAAIMPVAQYGGEKFSENIRKLRRTKITMQAGAPFVICPDSAYPDKVERQLIADEMMYQMAGLLPAEYRGYYSDLSKTTTNYLNFNVSISKSIHQPWWKKVLSKVRKYQSSFKNPAV